MIMLFLPIFAVLLNVEFLLLKLGQDAAASQYAQHYVRVFLPGLFFSGMADCQRRFLCNFKKNNYCFISGLIGISLHGLWCYIFVFKYELAIVGIGIANVFSNAIIFGSLLVFTHHQDDLEEALQMPDSRIFRGLNSYFILAFPSTLMLILDWGAFEILVLISGFLGVTEQASCILIMNIVVLAYMVAEGFDTAACTLVGQAIGAGDADLARKYFKSF